VCPEGKSLDSIKNRCPSAYKHYCSPFWQAIQVKERSDREWEDFYRTLDERVVYLVFEFLHNPKQPYEGIKSEKKPLVKLIRIGDDHAVAALIGLTRQFGRNLIQHDYIETQLYNIMFNFMSEFFSYDAVLPVYQFLYEQFLNRPEADRLRLSPWPNDANTVFKIIGIEYKNLLIAEDLGMVATYQQRREFFFWKYMGDRFEIIKEMTYALDENKWALTDHPKGLKWLIHNLNKTRPKNHKLDTRYL
jgi:hypothetical protein